MLSRVADSIYWLSRSIERAENIARFIDVNLQMMLDLPVLENEQWQPLVTITGDESAFLKRYDTFTEENVIRFLTFDPENPNSIVSCVRQARENARSVREVISSEMWEQINRYFLLITSPRLAASPGHDLHSFFTQVRIGSQLFDGITDATMSHGEGWHFARLGRLIERADKTSRLLDVKYFILLPRVEYVGTSFDQIQWAAVLKSAGALEMYRKVRRRIVPQDVAEFLIFDRDFPRALRYCLMRASWSLHTISGGERDSYANEAERRIGLLRNELDYARLDDVFETGLHQYLDDVQVKLNDIGEAVFESFFSWRRIGRSDA